MIKVWGYPGVSFESPRWAEEDVENPRVEDYDWVVCDGILVQYDGNFNQKILNYGSMVKVKKPNWKHI